MQGIGIDPAPTWLIAKYHRYPLHPQWKTSHRQLSLCKTTLRESMPQLLPSSRQWTPPSKGSSTCSSNTCGSTQTVLAELHSTVDQKAMQYPSHILQMACHSRSAPHTAHGSNKRNYFASASITKPTWTRSRSTLLFGMTLTSMSGTWLDLMRDGVQGSSHSSSHGSTALSLNSSSESLVLNDSS